MSENSKLKPVNEGKQFLLTVFVSLGMVVIFILLGALYGEPALDRFIAIMMAVAAWLDLMVMIRTRNLAFLPAFFWQSLMAARLLSQTENKTVIAIYAVTVIFLAGIHFYMMAKKRTKWRYREMLELAAQPVEDKRDGYTDRPYPSGRAEYTPEELRGFARFLQKKMIALPYFETERVVFQIEPTFWHLFYLRYGYRGYTHVSFGRGGDISVYISQKSYKKYRDLLSFDQLCRSMGGLFGEFLELYKSNKMEKIIARMNALKISAMAG